MGSSQSLRLSMSPRLQSSFISERSEAVGMIVEFVLSQEISIKYIHALRNDITRFRRALIAQGIWPKRERDPL